MEPEVNINVSVGPYLEEILADEAEERRLDCDSGSEIPEGDIFDDLFRMNVSVELTNRDLTEADVTEVDQEFTDALVEIEGQKGFPCTKCDKTCKSKGGLTRHMNSKHQDRQDESAGSGCHINTGLCQDTITSIVDTIKNNIIEENIYGEEINNGLKMASSSEALFKAILPLYENFLKKKNQDKLLESFYGLVPRSCEFLNCDDFRVANLIMIHIPDHLVGFYNISQIRDKGESNPGTEPDIQINPAERGPLSYIGGYVISKLFQRNKGKSAPENKELQVLLQTMKSSSVLENSFISARSRGGLVTPCNDLVGILEKAELFFRKEVAQTEKTKQLLRNIPSDSICFSTMQSPTVKSLWDNIVLASGINSTTATSKLCLENVVRLYLKVRSFSYAKDYVTKYKIREKQVKRKSLRKDMKESSDKQK